MDSYAITVRRLPGIHQPGPLLEAAPKKRAVPSLLRRVARRAGRLSLNIVFLAMVGCAALMLLPAMLGYQRFVIMTGSMTGTYDRGSIVYDRPVPVSQLKVGDPITYSPPPGFTSQARVSHRIWSIRRGPNGERIFRTKGDANKHPDAWTFTLNQPMQDKVIFHIPEVGYLFLLLSLRDFRIAIVGVPAVIIGLIMLRGVWREGGVEARRQALAKAGWRQLADPSGHAVLKPLDRFANVEPRPAWIDLRLGPARTGSADLRTDVDVAQPSGVDRNAPLRVRRLPSALAIGSEGDAARSPKPFTRIVRSQAATQLRVMRLVSG